MQTIWKFPLAIMAEQTVVIPGAARLLSVQMQNGVLCLWAVVNPLSQRTPYTIRMYGTGHGHEVIKGQYLGTVQVQWACVESVGHFFDVTGSE